MCGITGFAGDYSEELLQRMNDRIRHRGPDGYGIWYDRQHHVGLAHRRLSIIDLSPTGAQPMWSAGKSAVIVYNGEIYNYRDLRGLLEKNGCRFRGTCDTEVLINLYEAYGEAMLPMLNGIFALAIWDTRTKRLMVARDGLGVKPLYYMFTPTGFYFSSEIKSFLAVPDRPRDVDIEALHYYLSYMWCPAPQTPIKGILKLEPGHVMTVEHAECISKRQFYEITVGRTDGRFTAKDAIHRCDELLSQAVRRQLVADVEVGTFLSGGLDSSSVTYYAGKYTGGSALKTFSMRYDADDVAKEGVVDDLPYARQAAEAFGADLNIVETNYNLFDELPFMLYHLDEPQADPAALNVYYLCKKALKHGIKVLLSGAGGDDVFTGYRRHQALNVRKTIGRVIPGSLLRQLGWCSDWLPEHPAFLRRIKKACFSASFSGAELLESYFKWMRDVTQRQLYSGDFAAELTRVSPIIQAARCLPHDASLIDKMLFLEMKHFLADHNLNYTDKMSMATGVEVRVPFLDPDLIEFAFSLPAHFKQHGFTSKWVLKKAMEPYLPRNIIYRPKTGFGIPLRKIMKINYYRIVEDYLSKSSLKKRGFFDPEKVTALIEANHADRIEAGYTVFSLICIEVWMRIFIDGKTEGLVG